MPYSRDLPEIILSNNDGVLEGIRKCAIGTVTAIKGGLVDVAMATNSPLFDEFGDVSFEAAPLFSNVPLCQMRGGGFQVALPVAVGDSVLVVFTDLSADTWRASQGGQAVNPGWVGRHTADSPFAIPCVAPDANLSAPPSGKVTVGAIGGNQISVSATDIELGGTQAIALASKIDLFIQTVMTWIPVANDGGAALKSALSSAGFSTSTTTASTVTKSG